MGIRCVALRDVFCPDILRRAPPSFAAVFIPPRGERRELSPPSILRLPMWSRPLRTWCPNSTSGAVEDSRFWTQSTGAQGFQHGGPYVYLQ